MRSERLVFTSSVLGDKIESHTVPPWLKCLYIWVCAECVFSSLCDSYSHSHSLSVLLTHSSSPSDDLSLHLQSVIEEGRLALQTNNCRRDGEGIMLLTSKEDGSVPVCEVLHFQLHIPVLIFIVNVVWKYLSPTAICLYLFTLGMFFHPFLSFWLSHSFHANYIFCLVDRAALLLIIITIIC